LAVPVLLTSARHQSRLTERSAFWKVDVTTEAAALAGASVCTRSVLPLLLTVISPAFTTGATGVFSSQLWRVGTVVSTRSSTTKVLGRMNRNSRWTFFTRSLCLFW
jgi:hypothetical protein